VRTPERKALATVALATLAVAYTFGFGPFGGVGLAASTASVVDFSQCANDPAPVDACAGGWINGILNGSNSDYHEGEVVPQRLVLTLPAGSPGTGRTITLQYETRKGTVHAYDSLATWNHSQTAAGRCDGLAAADCPGGLPSSYAIPDDPASVPPATLNGAVTTSHMLSGAARMMTMYGGTITGVAVPSHHSSGGNELADVIVTYSVPSTASDTNVQLLFGGHLASSLGTLGWGPGLGSSAISGGSWHSRVIAADGASLGNRDNQIQSSSIGEPSISTTQVPSSGSVGVVIHDTATLAGGFSPSGSVTFDLYPPSDPTCAGTPVFSTDGVIANGAASSGTYATTVVGTYRWIATYPGDSQNAPAKSGCTEEPVVTAKAKPGIATVPVPSDATTGTPIHDTATVSDAFSPTGGVTFWLYGPSDPTCDGEPLSISTGQISNGTASSDPYTVTQAGTYHWVASYSGDDNNQTAASGCNEEPVTVSAVVQSELGTPSITTVPVPSQADLGASIHDTASVTGGNDPSGTVTFQLYPPSDASCTGTPVLTSTVALAAGTATSGNYETTQAGTYHWVASYSGDDNNQTAASGCNEEPVKIVSVLGTKIITPGSAPVKLPKTGTDIMPLVAGALWLITVGAFISWLPQRRRTARAGEI
jgi:Bacterial Ig-like domain (group 3)